MVNKLIIFFFSHAGIKSNDYKNREISRIHIIKLIRDKLKKTQIYFFKDVYFFLPINRIFICISVWNITSQKMEYSEKRMGENGDEEKREINNNKKQQQLGGIKTMPFIFGK